MLENEKMRRAEELSNRKSFNQTPVEDAEKQQT